MYLHSLETLHCRWRRLETEERRVTMTASRGEVAGLHRDKRDYRGVKGKESGAQRLSGLGVRGEGSGMKLHLPGW